MCEILKRKDFSRWQTAEELPDTSLCKAVQEMEGGLVDADLGAELFKIVVAFTRNFFLTEWIYLTARD